MLTLNANWVEAFERAQRVPILLLTLTRDETTSYRWLSGERLYPLTVPNAMLGFVGIKANPAQLDDLTRAVTVGNWELVFADEPNQAGRLRELVADWFLKGKKIGIELGEAGLAEADFEAMIDNAEIDAIKISKGAITLSVIDAAGQMLDRTVNPLQWPGHPCRIMREAIASRVPAGMVDTAAFDETLYTDTSHFVVCRHPWMALYSAWIHPQEDRSMQKLRDLLQSLAQLVQGSVVSTEDGLISFTTYDRAATADRTFSKYEIAEFEQSSDIYRNTYNDVRMLGLDHDGVTMTLYRGTDEVAKTKPAWPGESDRPIELSIPDGEPHPWLNSYVKVFGSGVGPTVSIDAAETELYLHLPHWFGLCGTTIEDGSGNRVDPPTLQVQQTLHKIDGVDRVGYFLLTDGTGLITTPDEIVKVTAFEYCAPGGGALTGALGEYITLPGPGPSSRAFWQWGHFTIERGALGTVAQNWSGAQANGRLFVYDITIAVWLVQRLLDRYAYGSPEISVKVPTRNLDVQIGDTINFERAAYLAYESNGLTTDTLWEVVEKSPELAGANPGWRLRCARIRRGAVVGLPDVTRQDDETPVVVDLEEPA